MSSSALISFMRKEALDGLVRYSEARDFGGSRRRYLMGNHRYSASELRDLAWLESWPYEHLDYIAGRLRATIDNARADGLLDRVGLASALLHSCEEQKEKYKGIARGSIFT